MDNRAPSFNARDNFTLPMTSSDPSNGAMSSLHLNIPPQLTNPFIPNTPPSFESFITDSSSYASPMSSVSTPTSSIPLTPQQLLASNQPSVPDPNSANSSPQAVFPQYPSPMAPRSVEFPAPPTMPNPGHPSAANEEERIVGSSSRRCEVCKEYASGNHYGCWTCEGCKAFFKRSVQAQSQYTCVSGNQCDVEGAGRKNCPACRLRRCFEVGMTAESIKRDRRYNLLGWQEAAVLYRQENQNAYKMLNKLIEIEMKPISADFVLPEAGDENISANTYLIKLFARLADRLLSFYVEWAKSVPGYSSLSLSTQRSLLSRCFFVEALLDVVYRSMQLAEGQVRISADIAMTQNALIVLSNGKHYEVHEELMEACKLFKSLRVSHEEYLSLKFLVLVSSEDLTDVAMDLVYLKTLQDKALDCLAYAVHETCYRMDPKSSEEAMQRRTSKFLIAIGRLNRLSVQVLTHLTQLRDTIPIFELVGSLLNQNDTT